MQIELDHLFVCTAPGAPEAEELVQFGLHEGPPNQHPGQGTACRRFSFANAMIIPAHLRFAVRLSAYRLAGSLLARRKTSAPPACEAPTVALPTSVRTRFPISLRWT